jgi:hypothetical protein
MLEEAAMKHSLRLLIPIGLAVVAAIVNYLTMTSATRPVNFVQVTGNLKVGEPFSESNLGRLQLPATFEGLSKTAVPFEHIGVLYGQPASREFRAGDVVFWRDSAEGNLQIRLEPDEEIMPVPLGRVETIPALLRIGGAISFRFKRTDGHDKSEAEWIGPFRIVSVGNRFTDDKEGSPSSENLKLVSVAVKRRGTPGRDSIYDQLEEYCDLQSMEKAKLLRIKYHLPSARPQTATAGG